MIKWPGARLAISSDPAKAGFTPRPPGSTAGGRTVPTQFSYRMLSGSRFRANASASSALRICQIARFVKRKPANVKQECEWKACESAMCRGSQGRSSRIRSRPQKELNHVWPLCIDPPVTALLQAFTVALAPRCKLLVAWHPPAVLTE